MPQNPYDAFDTPVRRTVTPSDPTLPGKITGQGLQNAKDRADLTRTQGMTPAEIAKAVADAQRSEADAERIRLETEATRLQQEQAVRAREGNVSNLAQMISNLDALQADASDNGGWFETGYTGSLLRDRPGTAAYDLRGRVTGVQGGQFIEALRNLKSQSATGATGAGALTEQEGNRILAATGNLDPNQSQQQFVDQIAQARQAALEAYRRLGGADPNIDPDGAVQRQQQQVDRTSPLVGGPGQPDHVAFGTQYRDEVDPILKGVAGKLGGLVAAGRSDQEIRQFLQQNGVDPSTTNVDKVLQYRQTPQYKVWQRANPGKAYPIGSDFYTKKVPLSFGQKVGNAAAQSGAGAYFINAGQAVTGNRLDDLAGLVGGDADAVNTGVELSRANSPTASFAGDLTGQTLAQYLMGRVPGFRALPGSSVGRMAEDAAYGFYAGSGDNEDGGDWLTNGLTGAATNVAGGKLGRGVAKGSKTLLTGVQDDSLRYLHQRGVPLTLGQISRGSGGAVGDSIAGIEERIGGFPFLDGIVKTARRRGDEGFNQAAFREFGGSGATGSQGIGEGRDIMANAYAFLDNEEFPIDTIYKRGQAKARALAPTLPSYGREITTELGNLDATTKNGVLKGTDWQSGLSLLRSNRSSIAGKPFSDRSVNLLNDVEDNLLNLAYRQGGPNVEQQLIKANRQNGQFNTLVKALDNGPAQRADELFSANRLDTAARSNAAEYGGKAASMAGNRPFYELTSAGMKVMPNLTPDSGTAGRALLASFLAPAAAGAGFGGAYGAASNDMTAGQGAATGGGITGTGALLPTLALAGLYSKTGQKTLGKLLLSERPAVFNTISNKLNADNYIAKALRANISSRRAGQIGATTLRDLLMYPELQFPGQ